MKAKAHLKILRISARKTRLVADTVRGLPVTKALGKLEYDLRSSAPVIAKLIKSASANAVHNENYTKDDLIVTDIQVGEGPTLKRFRPRAYGRAFKILKRTSRITVVLSDELDEGPKQATKKVPQKTALKKESASQKKSSVASHKEEADDLTKVEGIGPKIAETLVAAGVSTFEKLSQSSVEDIQKIIQDVRGSHVTDTWPEQAKMAYEGKWEELEKWQDELDGGKA